MSVGFVFGSKNESVVEHIINDKWVNVWTTNQYATLKSKLEQLRGSDPHRFKVKHKKHISP